MFLGCRRGSPGVHSTAHLPRPSTTAARPAAGYVQTGYTILVACDDEWRYALLGRGLPLGQVYDLRGGSARLDRLDPILGRDGGLAVSLPPLKNPSRF